MAARFILYLCVAIWLYACNARRTPHSISVVRVDTASQTRPRIVKPVWGYRFSISGDFDGDGRRETLNEHFCSAIDHKETNKFYEGLDDYGDLVEMTVKKEPYSFLSCDKRIDTFFIADGGQLLGLAFLRNEGDLNGDGTDEVSYVINAADWSNLNTWYIATYKHHRWITLYSFPIWDWQLPDLPQTFNQYGLFGLENKVINTSDNKANRKIEDKLKKFKGLVKKVGKRKIQVTRRNDEGDMETTVIRLKK